MASIINASTSGAGGVITTADASGVLNLQSGGTTIAGVSSTGVAVTGTLSATGAFTPTSMGGSVITSGTAVASTSGTSIDFTGIPLWVKRVTIMFNGVSTNGSSNVHVQLGDSGGVETSGYVAAGEQQNTQVAYTTGFGIPYNTSTNLLTGIFEIAFFNGTTYVTSGILGTQATCGSMQGSKTLTGTLDRVRITTVNGTDTFDAGSINILYEG